MERLGPYRIIGRLGAGAMGEVWLAEHEMLHAARALKVLPRQLEQSAGFRERVLAEGRVLAALDHPHIVKVHDMGIEGETHYIAMDFISPDGKRSQSLDDLLRERDVRINQHDTLRILRQICEGIAYAHKRGVIHRDIKPSNVLIGVDGAVSISDFGLAKVVGDKYLRESIAESLSTARGATKDSIGAQESLRAESSVSSGAESLVGTFHYMPPEVQDRGEWTKQGDIYSLGVLTYVLLVGKRPVGRWKLPSEVNPNLLTGWDAIIEQTLAESPNDRYASVEAFIAALDSVGRESESDDKLKKGSSRTSSNNTRLTNPLIAVSLLGFCLFLAVAAFFFYHGGAIQRQGVSQSVEQTKSETYVPVRLPAGAERAEQERKLIADSEETTRRKHEEETKAAQAQQAAELKRRKQAEEEAAKTPRVLFSDDFRGVAVDSSRWETHGNRVEQQNGEMRITEAQTDTYARAVTTWIEFDPTLPIELTREVKLHTDYDAHNNGYHFMGSLAMEFDGLPEPSFWLKVFYGKYDDWPGANDDWTVKGFCIGKRGSMAFTRAKATPDFISALTTGIFDEWFTERIVFDPKSGEVSYYINGALRLHYNCGSLPHMDHCRMRWDFCPYGWNTVHYGYMKALVIKQGL